MFARLALSLVVLSWAAAAQKPELVVQTGHSDAVIGLAFSPDDKFLVTGSSDSTIKLWDIRAGRELRTLTGMRGGSFVSFRNDGRMIATGGDDHVLRVWDAASLKLIRSIDTGHMIRAVAFSPDGSILAVASTDKMIHLWRTADWQPIGELSGHKDEVLSIAFSTDGKLLASGGADTTVTVWDLESRRAIRTLTGHTGHVQTVFIMPGGKTVMSSSDSDGYKIWDLATGQSRQPMGTRTVGHGVGFSPDGAMVAVTESENNTTAIRLRQAATGVEIRVLARPPDWFYWYRFSHDGKTLAVGGRDDGTVTLWEVATGREIHSLTGHTETMTSIAFSPDGRLLAAGSTGRDIRIWDLSTRTAIATLAGHTRGVGSLVFNPDGSLLASASGDKTARLWDVAAGREIASFKYSTQEINDRYVAPVAAAFSPDGKTVAVGSHDLGVRFWDVATHSEVFTGRLRSGHAVNSLLFTADGKRLITGGLTRVPLQAWDLGTGSEIALPTRQTLEVGPVAMSPNGNLLASVDLTGRLEILDVSAGEAPQLIAEQQKRGSALAWSPNNRTLAVSSLDGPIQVLDVLGHKAIQLGPAPEDIRSLAFHPGGKVLASAGQGPRIRLWDAESGRELCSLFSVQDGSWAVVDPEGRYDASGAGRVDWLHWVAGNEAIALDQLKERYYEPGLVAKAIGANSEPVRNVSAFEGVELYPEVLVAAPSPGTAKVGIQLTDRGGGIGRVQVLMNGKEIASDARAGARQTPAGRLDLTVDLSAQPFLKPGEENTLEVRAFNQAGYLSSRGVRAVYQPPGLASKDRPSFWAIVAGISTYSGPDLHLLYAAKDATDMARALQIGANRLFGAGRTHIALLATSEDPGALLPTKANLQKAFEAARQAKPGDVLVVYLAGHGVSYGGPEGDYYYLAQEARTGDLTDPAIRKTSAISSAELTEWIRRIPVLKQTLVLDTCGAGRLVERLTRKRAVPSSQIRALERMKDRMGLFILAGSAADAVSYEASRYSQGLLTYSLLLGMKGAALRENQLVDVSKWFDFAADEVPRLAKDIGGIQRPLIAVPRGGASFDIGLIPESDRKLIPVANVRPLFLRSSFQDEARLQDHLRLAGLVDEELRVTSARGQGGDLVYVDSVDLPDAYSLTGRYRVQGGEVTASVSVFRGDRPAGKFSVTGKAAALKELAAAIVAKAIPLAK